MKSKSSFALVVLAVFSIGMVESSEEQTFKPTLFSTSSRFTLNSTALVMKSAFVVLTDEFFSGQTRALKILFSPDPITAETKSDILNNDGKMIRKKDHVIILLFIDTNNQIWQVNLTFVIPGQTVVRTVAWRPEELRHFSSNYFYDGNRLKFKNEGNYKDPNSEKHPVNLTWEVSFDIPVFDRISVDKK